MHCGLPNNKNLHREAGLAEYQITYLQTLNESFLVFLIPFSLREIFDFRVFFFFHQSSEHQIGVSKSVDSKCSLILDVKPPCRFSYLKKLAKLEQRSPLWLSIKYASKTLPYPMSYTLLRLDLQNLNVAGMELASS